MGLREGSEDRGDPRGKRVQDFGGAEHPGVTAAAPAPRNPRLCALCLWPGQEKGRDKSHEHPSGEQLAVEGERWGKCLTLWCQSKEGGLPVVDCAGA